MKVQPSGCGKRPFANVSKLGAHSRLGIFGKWNCPAEHMKNRRLAPVETVAEIQIDRPVPRELWARFRLDRRARLGLATDPRREPVGTLTFQRSIDRHRAVDPVAAAIERHRAGPFDVTVNVAIGIDLPEQNAAVHAAHLFVDRCETFGNIRLDVRCELAQAELHRGRDARVGREWRHGVGGERRLFCRERIGTEAKAAKRGNPRPSRPESGRALSKKARSRDRSHETPRLL